MPAAHAEAPLVAADAVEPVVAVAEPPAAEEQHGLVPVSARAPLPAAEAASVDREERHVEVEPAAEYSVAPGFSPGAVPVFPAGQVRMFLSLPAASAGGQPCHAAGNGNSACEASAAALPGDTCPRYTAAGKREAERAPEQSSDSSGSTRFGAVPSHCPSAVPSVAAHSTATR